jgi:hypothetical protein
MHIESGHSLKVNVSILEIILPNVEGYQQYTEPINALVDKNIKLMGDIPSMKSI